MAEEFVSSHSDIKSLEKNVRNKFNWKWLEEEDANGDLLSSYIRKLNLPGLAYCGHCKCKVDYSGKGKSAIKRHAESAHHKKLRNCHATNQTLPAAYKTTKTFPIFSFASRTPSSSQPAPAPTPVVKNPSFKDRVSHQEAMLCSFIAEHSLPLSMAPHLIELAQTLALDPKALQALQMERQTLTYKLKYGLHEMQRMELITMLKQVPFSINLDESTSKHNKKRILNVLVCFFDANLDKSVTHLYCALELVVVNAKTVYDAVITKLQEDSIPMSNLISTLTDSAAYMRGSESGFQRRLRDDYPHVIDIDGDVCHHIHNISRSFCTSLDPENSLAHLLDDIYRDFMWSPDIREDFLTISRLLRKPEILPKERIGIRWLSMLDSCKTLDSIKEGLTVVYFAWLPRADKDLYKEQIQLIFSSSAITPAVRQSIFEILRRLRGKNLTQLGTQRKRRIARKLFDIRREIDFLLNCVLSILPMFQKFILMFQQSTPQIHKLHDNMVGVFTDFVRLFVRAEYIRESAKNLSSLNLDDQTLLIPPKYIDCGKAESLLKSIPPNDAKNMRVRLLKTYISTAQYMQEKLPFNNSVIRLFSFLDPLAFGQTDTAIALRALPAYFPTINSESFSSEIMAMQSNCNIPTGKEIDLDQWWAHVFKLEQYPSVQRIVTACLSVFTGPKVEASFSFMNNIITKSSSCLTIPHYEAILAIKYKLLSLKTTTCKLFKRPDPIQSPVDHGLALHMQTSCAKFKAEKLRRKAAKEEKDKALLNPPLPPVQSTQIAGRKRKGTFTQSSSHGPKRAK